MNPRGVAVAVTFVALVAVALWIGTGRAASAPVADAPRGGAAAESADAEPFAADLPRGAPSSDRTALPEPSRETLLTGRLLAPSGAPLAGARPRMRVTGASLVSRECAAATDGDGRFRLPWDADDAAGPLALEVRDHSAHGVVGAVVALPEVVRGATVDVGDVRLQGLVAVAHGQIVDDAGRAVAGAAVSAHEVRRVRHSPFRLEIADGMVSGGEMAVALELVAGEPGSFRLVPRAVDGTAFDAAAVEDRARAAMARTFALRVLDLNGEAFAQPELRLAPFRSSGAAEAVRSWSPSGSLRALGEGGATIAETRSRADGSFELWAPAAPDMVSIAASADQHRDAGQDVARGTSLTLALHRTREVIGVVRIPAWLPPAAVEVELRRHGEDGEQLVTQLEGGDRVAATEAIELSFGFAAALLGTHDLAVRVRGFPAPLCRLEHVAVEPPGVDLDPRLSDIDLTARVFRHELRAVDARGAVLRDIPSPLLVRVPQAGGERATVGFPWRDGAVEVFGPEAMLDVTLLCAGYKATRLSVPPGQHDLTFVRIWPVEIVLPDVRRLCGAGRKVRVSLVHDGDSGFPGGLSAIEQRSGASTSYSRWHLGNSGGAWLGEGDVVEVPLVVNGKYDVLLRLHEEGVGGDVSLSLGEFDVVLDGAGPQRLVVQVDASAIGNAIRQLEQRKAAQAAQADGR